MTRPTKTTIINSAIWAAYGDALGFITELVDMRALRTRVHGERVSKTLPWRRSVGGRFGANVELPSGCYSDDTQLRLATSRCIRADGYFDVGAFAKVELPVWRSYALGAGRATKAAASSLAKEDKNWFSNFFEIKDLSYLRGGGNGGAMRIQPHVWSHRVKANEPVLLDVIRNCVCTHGHVRAIAGACFHALCLNHTLESREIPDPHVWRQYVDELRNLSRLISSDPDLHSFWLPVWEERTRLSFDKSIAEIQSECYEDIDLLLSCLSIGSPDLAYARMTELIGGLRPESRGSGIKTAILASALSWLYKDDNPRDAMIAAANLLGSDTDTIATMAGAIIGAVSTELPDGDLLDHQYLCDEATRLFEVSQGRSTKSFEYPDLLKWTPPKTMIDVVQLAGKEILVAGLGSAEPVGKKFEARKDDDTLWQWMKLSFGQTILIKFRKTLTQINPNNVSISRSLHMSNPTEKQKVNQGGLFDGSSDEKSSSKNGELNARSLNSLTSEAIRSGFNPALIGSHLMKLAEQVDGIELSIAYAAVIAKAKRARVEARTRDEHKASSNPK